MSNKIILNLLSIILLINIIFHACNGRDNMDKIKHTVEFISKTYFMNRVYKSMEGPSSSQEIVLLETKTPELLWITGYRTIVVGPDGKTPINQEFMCHNNIDYDVNRHRTLFGWSKHLSFTPRMFTLSQGQFSIEFPEGFGIPVMSNETFTLSTQVLNHNIKDKEIEVRHRVFVDFVRDKDLQQPLKPLFSTNAFVMALLEGPDGVYGVQNPNEIQEKASCLPGLHAKSAKGQSLYSDGYGRRFSGHWVVKPGKEVRHTRVTDIMNIPYETTIHHIVLHLHPFAESLELKDITTGETLFKSYAKAPKKGIGLAKVNEFSSVEGIKVYKDHEYDLVSHYNNTTSVDQDAMATMFIYLLDKEFKKPEINYSEETSTHTRLDVKDISNYKSPIIKTISLPPKKSDEYIILHTVVGDITLALYPEVAPNHVKQILKLMKMGVYDTNHFFRVEPGFIIQIGSAGDRSAGPLTAKQQSTIKTLKAEFSDLKHARGVLSMARAPDDPNSAETSFSILLADAPHLDKKYTIFGRVDSGFDTIEKILEIPRQGKTTTVKRIEIIKAEAIKNP